ncbi:MAG: hypothetical protein WEC75_00795 [Dehalococcoidia bacterium]
MLLLVTAASCGADSPTPPHAQPSPVVGLISDVEVSGEDVVEAIVLVDRAGTTVRFLVEFEPGAHVDAEHLRLHQEQRLPVSVHFRPEGNSYVAYRIDDA